MRTDFDSQPISPSRRPNAVRVIAGLPDDEAATATVLTVGAAGGATVETVKLLTPEQVDGAIGRAITYRPPGM